MTRRPATVLRSTVALLAVGSLAAPVAGATAAAATAAVAGGTTVTVVEHAVTDTEVPTGGGKDVGGDVLTFHNKVFDKTNSHQVGTDLGFCIRIDPAEKSWSCEWTTFLAGGQINVAGPYYDNRNSILAVTGGTGKYRGVQGQMKLIARDGGKEYDFVFQLD